MAFNRPTLTEIVNRIAADFSSKILNGASALRRSVIRAASAAYGAAVHALYGFLKWISRESMVDTAIDTFPRHASIWKVPRNSATFADGDVVFEGTDLTILSALSVLQRADGVLYTVQADGVVAGGTVTVNVVCQTAGDTGNMLAGETLTLVTPIAGIQSAGVVDADGISGGSNVEDIEAWRLRVLARIQRPSMGGNDDDYEAWAKEVTGVTRVWVYPAYMGAGTVGVAFVRDGDVPIFPSVGEVADVQDHIDEVKPTTADVLVFAPTGQALNFTIAITPDTAAVRAAVEAELTDLINRRGEPGGTIYISEIREAVSSAAGEVDNIISSPTMNQIADPGKLYQMGTITWV